MNYILVAIIFFYLIGFWLMLRSSDAPKIDWWQFVDEAISREKKADFNRKFRVFGPRFGQWRDMGFTDTKDAGFTLGYDD